ncbi:MAG: hypothetical protein FWC89_04840 [Defluviitaleaceae bacterium]|nr:hypothetical protein [Defluviitaleaceae bacterium]
MNTRTPKAVQPPFTEDMHWQAHTSQSHELSNEANEAKKLWLSIGEIDENIIEEAELADIASTRQKRRRYVRYGTIAAAASIGIAATTFFILKSKKKVA